MLLLRSKQFFVGTTARSGRQQCRRIHRLPVKQLTWAIRENRLPHLKFILQVPKNYKRFQWMKFFDRAR